MLNNDEKALLILEKAVEIASSEIVKKETFNPFLLLMDENDEIRTFNNDIDDSTDSYNKLSETAIKEVKKGNVSVLVLVVDTIMPDKFNSDEPNTIRLHLEEAHLINEKISARYIFVPYNLYKDKEDEIFIDLGKPTPVAFPAEFIK